MQKLTKYIVACQAHPALVKIGPVFVLSFYFLYPIQGELHAGGLISAITTLLLFYVFCISKLKSPQILQHVLSFSTARQLIVTLYARWPTQGREATNILTPKPNRDGKAELNLSLRKPRSRCLLKSGYNGSSMGINR